MQVRFVRARYSCHWSSPPTSEHRCSTRDIAEEPYPDEADGYVSACSEGAPVVAISCAYEEGGTARRGIG